MPVSKEKPIVMLIAVRQGSFSREVLRGILSVSRDQQVWDIWVVPPIHDQHHLETCLENRNVIGAVTRGLPLDLVEVLEKRDIPVVSIRGPEDKENVELNGPHVDDRAIGSIAGGEFARLNLRQWGFVHWQGVAWSEARMESLQVFAASRGIRVEVLSLPEEKRHNWLSVLDIESWLSSLVRPCGILACNDEAGVDVLHACKLIGMQVPYEVAVIGVDNDRLLCESSSPTLSSINLYAEDIGRAAALQLNDLLGGGGGYDDLPIGRASMVVRESSHEVDHYLLSYQRAIDFITGHALTGPSVLEVADACGVSKRGLERAFAKHASCSPAELIREQRVVGILQLLKNRTMSLAHVAQQCGFSDAVGLSNFIKRATGKPPGAWR